MKRLLILTIGLLVLMLSSQCKSGKISEYNSYFWTSSGQDTIHYLFIDGKNVGVLPYLSNAPACFDDSKNLALNFPLKPGQYKLEMKDKQGTVKYAETLTILDQSPSGGSIGKSFPLKQGGSGISNSGNCIIEELHYSN